MNLKKLEERWFALPWPKNINKKLLRKTFLGIIAAYTDKTRHYHNLDHISECLAHFDCVRNLVRNPFALELAIWYHDIVYEMRPKPYLWNELMSVARAKWDLTKLRLSRELICSVQNLIFLSGHHTIPKYEDGCLMIDIDLSILGETKRKVDSYDTAIKKESTWIKDEQLFRRKRLAILKLFRNRRPLYLTPFFRKKYEKCAKRNLARLMKRYAK